MKQKFNVTGMTCSACSAHVEKAVRQVEGVDSVSVNLLGNSMLVEYGGKTGPEQIIQAVTDAGYGASLPGPAGKAAAAARPAGAMEEELAGMKRRFLTSLVFLAPLFYIAMGHMMGWPLPAFFHQPSNALVVAFLQFLLTLPILYINRKYYTVGFKTLWHRAPNMDSLIALGSSAAVLYGVAALFLIAWHLGRAAYGAGDAAAELAQVEHWAMAGDPLQGQDQPGHHQFDGSGPQDRHGAAGRRGGRGTRGGRGGGRPHRGPPRRPHPGGRGGHRGGLLGG